MEGSRAFVQLLKESICGQLQVNISGLAAFCGLHPEKTQAEAFQEVLLNNGLVGLVLDEPGRKRLKVSPGEEDESIPSLRSEETEKALAELQADPCYQNVIKASDSVELDQQMRGLEKVASLMERERGLEPGSLRQAAIMERGVRHEPVILEALKAELLQECPKGTVFMNRNCQWTSCNLIVEVSGESVHIFVTGKPDMTLQDSQQVSKVFEVKHRYSSKLKRANEPPQYDLDQLICYIALANRGRGALDGGELCWMGVDRLRRYPVSLAAAKERWNELEALLYRAVQHFVRAAEDPRGVGRFFWEGLRTSKQIDPFAL